MPYNAPPTAPFLPSLFSRQMTGSSLLTFWRHKKTEPQNASWSVLRPTRGGLGLRVGTRNAVNGAWLRYANTVVLYIIVATRSSPKPWREEKSWDQGVTVAWWNRRRGNHDNNSEHSLVRVSHYEKHFGFCLRGGFRRRGLCDLDNSKWSLSCSRIPYANDH